MVEVRVVVGVVAADFLERTQANSIGGSIVVRFWVGNHLAGEGPFFITVIWITHLCANEEVILLGKDQEDTLTTLLIRNRANIMCP